MHSRRAGENGRATRKGYVQLGTLFKIPPNSFNQTTGNSPKRDRSSSPMDMEMSSDEDEDGQITKQDQQDERTSRLLDLAKHDDDEVTMQDFERCRLARSDLIKYSRRPWFAEYAKGVYIMTLEIELHFIFALN